MSNERQQRAARAEQMRKEREKADRKQRNLITVGIVVVVIALIAVGGYAVKSESDKNKTVEQGHQPPRRRPRTSASTTRPRWRPASPQRTRSRSIAYEDFQCPACLQLRAAERRVPRPTPWPRATITSSIARSRSSTTGAAPTGTRRRAGQRRDVRARQGRRRGLGRRCTTCSTPTSRKRAPTGPTDAELIDYAKQAGTQASTRASSPSGSCHGSTRPRRPTHHAMTRSARPRPCCVGGKEIESADRRPNLQKAIAAAKKS